MAVWNAYVNLWTWDSFFWPVLKPKAGGNMWVSLWQVDLNQWPYYFSTSPWVLHLLLTVNWYICMPRNVLPASVNIMPPSPFAGEIGQICIENAETLCLTWWPTSVTSHLHKGHVTEVVLYSGSSSRTWARHEVGTLCWVQNLTSSRPLVNQINADTTLHLRTFEILCIPVI